MELAYFGSMFVVEFECYGALWKVSKVRVSREGARCTIVVSRMISVAMIVLYLPVIGRFYPTSIEFNYRQICLNYAKTGQVWRETPQPYQSG